MPVATIGESSWSPGSNLATSSTHQAATPTSTAISPAITSKFHRRGVRGASPPVRNLAVRPPKNEIARDAEAAEERQTTRIRMNAPQVYAIRLRKPAEPCALSVSWRSSATWRFDLLVEQLHTREFGSTDCHEEPFLDGCESIHAIEDSEYSFHTPQSPEQLSWRESVTHLGGGIASSTRSRGWPHDAKD